MSAFTQATTKLRDLTALQKALKNIGFETTELHSTPASLYGYQGDERKQKAHLIIRREYVGSSSNDIGFLQQADGTITAIISEYDNTRYNDKWMKSLTQEYAHVKLQDELEAQGFFIDSTVRKDGKIFITAENPYL